MKISRPHIIARKSILPAFKAGRVIIFVVFAALAAVFAVLAKDLLEGIPALASYAPYAPLGAVVFGLVALVPLILIIVDVVILRSQYVEFYDSFVVKKRGVFNKTEEKCMFPKILSCHVHRTFYGRIFNYGNIEIDAIGKWDVDLTFIKRPLYIRKYLENHFISAKEIRAMRQTVVTQ